jgi:ribosomal protein S18 acetylase RimI-like enzyme
MSAFQRALGAQGPLIRRATTEDGPRIARVFAAAFARDPVFRWLNCGNGSYSAALEQFFRWTLKSRALAGGETWLAANGLAAAAWIPPYSSSASPRLLDDLRMLTTIIRLTGIRHLTRAAAMAAAIAEAQPQQPCFYLAFIGVAPRLQRAGLGSLLLKRMVERADAARAPAYLESSNPANLALYERAGFRVTGEIIARADAPPLFAMWRSPQTSPAEIARPLPSPQGSSTMSQ